MSFMLQPLALDRVQITDPFWSHWQSALRETTLEIEYRQCCDTGRIENFRRAAQGEKGTFEGRIYNDSDVYKWIEAASYSLIAGGPDERTEKRLQEVAEAVAAAQMEDGYLDTYFQLQGIELRWRNLHFAHEMYCMGHLLEAAVAHRMATGSRLLFDVALRTIAHVRSLFGPDKRVGYCGHEEFELGLLKVAIALEADGDHAGAEDLRSYSRWMIDARGHRPSPFEAEFEDLDAAAIRQVHHLFFKDGRYSGEYAQDDKPLREQDRVVGHAVRAMYLLAAATEAFWPAGDAEMQEAVLRIWSQLVGRQMYVTGGIGQTGSHEGFTKDYDLPNKTAYAETCAACGLVFWAHRLGLATGESEYFDVLERALYNGVLAGISLKGDKFFYENPLETDGSHHRSDWFDCACCPPNIARLIGSAGQFFVSNGSQSLQVHLPVQGRYDVEVGSAKVSLEIESQYPNPGPIRIKVLTPAPVEFALSVRIPGWCDDADFILSDGWPEMEYERGYATVRRGWADGDSFEAVFAMPPKWIATDTRVAANAGRVALTRGPLVYCVESCDLRHPAWSFDAQMDDELEAKPIPGMPPFVEGLTVSGCVDQLCAEGLYEDASAIERVPVETLLVPYFAWDNREPGSMQVWLRGH